MCVFSYRWRLLALAEPRRVQSNSQGRGLQPGQQEVRGGLRDGRHHLQLRHRPHQPVPNQRNNGKIQQAADQTARQAAAGSQVQRETPGNIMTVRGRIKNKHLL